MKLTLAIPTYNRARYLNVLLESIVDQVQPYLDDLEIVVSDNASSDDTPDVVARYAQRIPITYVRQAENIGSDRNFAELFMGAKGDYVWVIGDDDFLLPNALRAVVDVIDAVAPGIIFAMPVGFAEHIDVGVYPNEVIDARILSRGVFVERVNIFLSFLSSLIVNKLALRNTVTRESISALSDTCLTQFGWILPAVLLDQPLVHIPTILVAAKSGNGGGYAVFKVFIENSNRVLAIYFAQRPELIRKINNRALMRFFPNRIMRGKLSPDMLTENTREVARLFQAQYSDNVWYWLLVWPLLKSPPALRRITRLYQWSMLFFLEAVLWAKITCTGKRLRFRYPAANKRSMRRDRKSRSRTAAG